MAVAHEAPRPQPERPHLQIVVRNTQERFASISPALRTSLDLATRAIVGGVAATGVLVGIVEVASWSKPNVAKPNEQTPTPRPTAPSLALSSLEESDSSSDEEAIPVQISVPEDTFAEIARNCKTDLYTIYRRSTKEILGVRCYDASQEQASEQLDEWINSVVPADADSRQIGVKLTNPNGLDGDSSLSNFRRRIS